MGRSRIRGMASTRRLLRSIPDATRDEMVAVLDQGGRDIARIMAARAPRKTGALQAGIKSRVLKQSLRLQVGLIGTQKSRGRLFYGRILDLGRKAQTVRVTGRANTAPYLLRVRGISAKRFVTGQYDAARAIINKRLRGIWDRVLRRTAGGGSD